MTTRKKTILATLTAILIVFTVVFASLEFSKKDVYGQQVSVTPASDDRTISVMGSATTTVLPDLATVQFGVDTEATTAQEAISTNSQIMNSTVTAIQNAGISKDEISTSSFSINPVYNDSSPDPTTGIHQSILTGYRASNTLYVKTTKLSLVGSVLDAAVAAGANRVDSVSFSLSPAKQQLLQDDLLGKAVLDAKSRAEKALDPLGQKIIGVKTVNLSEFNAPPPSPMYYGAMANGMSASTPIFSSNQDVTTTANVIFLIGDQ